MKEEGHWLYEKCHSYSGDCWLQQGLLGETIQVKNDYQAKMTRHYLSGMLGSPGHNLLYN